MKPPEALDGAACAAPDIDVDLFFPTTDSQLAAAVAVCTRCPVRAACTTERQAVDAPVGVWGGVLWHEGRPVFRAPRPGRPPQLPLEHTA